MVVRVGRALITCVLQTFAHVAGFMSDEAFADRELFDSCGMEGKKRASSSLISAK